MSELLILAALVLGQITVLMLCFVLIQLGARTKTAWFMWRDRGAVLPLAKRLAQCAEAAMNAWTLALGNLARQNEAPKPPPASYSEAERAAQCTAILAYLGRHERKSTDIDKHLGLPRGYAVRRLETLKAAGQVTCRREISAAPPNVVLWWKRAK